MPRYDIITFDCYGTLIDWRTGISEAFRRIQPALRAEAVLEAYNEIEPIVESETYRPYRDVLIETATRVGQRLGSPLTRSEAAILPQSLPDWWPFPDTNPALERLRSSG
jgi:FMN phosphatase YigB (HAD superfamily)